MTFKEYLIKRKVTYDVAGDFAAQARADPRMADAHSLPELEKIVGTHHGFGVAEAAKVVWQAYLVECRRPAKPRA